MSCSDSGGVQSQPGTTQRMDDVFGEFHTVSTVASDLSVTGVGRGFAACPPHPESG